MTAAAPKLDGSLSVLDVHTAIYQTLRDLKNLGDVVLTPETPFKALGMTSLEMLTLAFELEDRWGIVIKDAYLDDFETIGEASATVLELVASRAG